MNYRTMRDESNKQYEDRLALVMDRVRQIPEEELLGQPWRELYTELSRMLLLQYEIVRKGASDEIAQLSEEEGREYNRRLYEGVRGEAYASCYGNPAYAVSVFGEEYGRIVCAVYRSLTSDLPSLFEGDYARLCLYAELLVEFYGCLQEEDVTPERLKENLYSFQHDNLDLFCDRNASRKVDPDNDYFTQILMGADLSEPAYLYRYGLPVGENEIQISAFLNTLPEEEIQAMADTYTEGYRIGFEVSGKDLSIKTTAEIIYPIGFERMVRAAVRNLEKLNLRCVTLPESTPANKQYDFDHKESRALWLDKAYVEREMEALRAAFERRRELARGYAGPAVIEVFGEVPFSPETKPERITYDEKQQELFVYERSRQMQVIYDYIVAKERSFTIISYPIPEIGDRFAEIFAETVRVNTLDYKKYQQMQQKIIDILDTGDHVHIQGMNGNRTDLTVKLYELKDPSKETIFENCVADVNIPVGEVFTSPVLNGTNGKLHVSQVYLEGLSYENLEIDFKDGRIADYHCTNFEDEAENRKYIKDNILMHHETIPMGEFAIGTNTTAFRMARVFGIADKMPILIAEKTGPHFAVGDTCYTYDEDNMTYNPDGKAIIARDNEISILRKEDVSKAYFNCHTDITIPYDELGEITVIRADGSAEDIIREGRFVVPGTEELNIPLEEFLQ